MSKSDNPVALFFADAHLDRHNWKNRPTLWGDSVHAFNFLCQKAISHGIPMIGAGDLIDVRRPEPFVIDNIRSALDNLNQNDVPFYYIQGQHELDRENPWLSSIHAHPQHINKMRIELEGFGIYGLDWTPADLLDEELSQIPSDISIFVCHQVWHEFMGDVSYEGTLRSVTVDTVVTGDFHETREILIDDTESSSSFVISPGSTNMRRITEPEKKYAFILHDNNQWERVYIPSRYVLRYEIRSEEDLVSVASEIVEDISTVVKEHNEKYNLPNNLRTPIVSIKHWEDVDDVWNVINETCSGIAYTFFRVLSSSNDSELIVEQQELQTLLEEGPDACLKLLLNQDSDLYKLGLRFIRSHDPEKEILEVRKDRGL
jgi:hypothetical protein